MGGGLLFAMCSAPDSYDVALSAEGVDICERMFDGDPITSNAQVKLNYDKAFAFKDFNIELNPMRYEISNIDIDPRTRRVKEHFNGNNERFIKDEEIILEPTTMCDIDETDIEQVELFTENLEELDDVQNIYTNINIL